MHVNSLSICHLNMLDLIECENKWKKTTLTSWRIKMLIEYSVKIVTTLSMNDSSIVRFLYVKIKQQQNRRDDYSLKNIHLNRICQKMLFFFCKTNNNNSLANNDNTKSIRNFLFINVSLSWSTSHAIIIFHRNSLISFPYKQKQFMLF